jgi:DHA2 family multidrug resistance protein
LFLGRILGLNTWQIGTWIFVLGISMMVAGFFVPLMVKYFRLRTIALVGFSLLALGTYFQANLNVNTSFTSLMLPQMLRGFATQLCFLSMVRLALGLLPVDQVKNGTSLFQLTMRLGAAIAVATANSFLIIRSEVHYHQFRETIGQGHHYASDVFDLFSSRLGPGLGGSPDTATASLQLLIEMSRRDALIRAFNEITIVVSICIVAAMILMPLIQSVRDHAAQAAKKEGKPEP